MLLGPLQSAQDLIESMQEKIHFRGMSYNMHKFMFNNFKFT